MSELIDNTIQLVEKFNDSIRSDLSSKNIDNSGEASNSIRIESTKNSVTSLGVDYLYYLDQGRGAGKFPPVDEIVKWVATKAVSISPYLVGRKIAREGTEIFKDKSRGIQLDQKRKILLDEINQNAAKWAAADVLVLIKQSNKKLK